MQQYFTFLHCATVELIFVISLLRTGIICFQTKTLDLENYYEKYLKTAKRGNDFKI